MRFAVLACILFGVSLAQAQVYSNEFLSIGAGARGQALGNSVVSSSTGIYSAYWNPAGLTAVDEQTGLLAGAMHAEQFAGATSYDFLAVSLPLSDSRRRLAISLIRQGTDDIPNTINLYNDDGTIDYGNITSFSVSDYALLVSYAQPTKLLDGKLSVGGNLKVIRRIIGDFSSAWGVGVDAAARYSDGPLAIGVMLRDATSTFNAWRTDLDDRTREVLLRTGNTLPNQSGSEVTRPSLLPSASYRFAMGGAIGVRPEATAWLTFDGQRNTLLSSDVVSADLNLGLEVDYRNIVYLRAGVDQWERSSSLGEDERMRVRPALGVGVRLKRASLDYAFANPGSDDSPYAHVISLEIGLRRPQVDAPD